MPVVLNRGRFALATPFRAINIASLPLAIVDTLPHETSATSLYNIAQLTMLKYREDTCASGQIFTLVAAGTECNTRRGRRCTLTSIFQPASMNLGPTTASHNLRGPAPESKEHILHVDDRLVSFPMRFAPPFFGVAPVLLRDSFAVIPTRSVRHGWRRVPHTSLASSRRPTRRSRSTLELNNINSVSGRTHTLI